MNHTCLCHPSQGWSSFTDPKGMESLGTTMVNKWSAQDSYMTEITAVSCSNHHASLHNWRAADVSIELTTYWVANRGAYH